MRIGVNATFLRYPHTGTGAYLEQLLMAMSAARPGLDVTLYVPRGGSVGGGWRYPLRQVPVPTRAGENWAKLFFEQVVFPRAAIADGCHVLHVPYFAPPMWKAESTVVTVHDLIPLMLREYSAGLQARAYSLLAATAARRAACLLADSRCTARDVVQRLRVPAARVRVAYLAAGDHCRPVTNPLHTEEARRRYGLPERYVLYYGGYDRRKRVATLVEAYARLRSRGASVPPLVLAGRLPDRDSAALEDPRPVVERNGLRDCVVFCGAFAEQDKPLLLDGAACLVFPSLYEGFGLPPLEAMACGTPVVAARAGSVPEVCGDAAALVHPDDSEALADALARVLSDGELRRQLRERGLARSARFAWSDCAAVTAAAYALVADRKALRARAAPTLTPSTSGGEERCLPSNNRFNAD